MVVTILGIASAVVVPQLMAAGTLGIQAAARLIVADLLFAQNEAIAAQEPRFIVFDPANESYQLMRTNPATGTDEVLTMGWVNGQANNYVVDFTDDDRFAGITIETVRMGSTDVTGLEFDDLGSPALARDASGGWVAFSDEVAIVVRFRQQTLTVRVQPFTGRVTVD